MQDRLASHVEPVWIEEYNRHDQPTLRHLVRKAVDGVWDAERDLPWETDVDPERLVAEARGNMGRPDLDLSGTAAARWSGAEWDTFSMESRAWLLSQFLHGEQAALLCAARIVETCPWPDGRAVAATQVADEARHVTAFARYVETRVGTRYSVAPELGSLLADIITDQRWDVVYLGMQVLVEGVALTAFGRLSHRTTEPLLRALLARVLADEARHVAFGMISLGEVYQELTAAELAERQEFALDAILRLARQQFKADVWERLGLPGSDAAKLVQRSRRSASFGRQVMARVVPSCQLLGLLDANNGWLRCRLAEEGFDITPRRVTGATYPG